MFFATATVSVFCTGNGVFCDAWCFPRQGVFCAGSGGMLVAALLIDWRFLQRFAGSTGGSIGSRS